MSFVEKHSIAKSQKNAGNNSSADIGDVDTQLPMQPESLNSNQNNNENNDNMSDINFIPKMENSTVKLLNNLLDKSNMNSCYNFLMLLLRYVINTPQSESVFKVKKMIERIVKHELSLFVNQMVGGSSSIIGSNSNLLHKKNNNEDKMNDWKEYCPITASIYDEFQCHIISAFNQFVIDDELVAAAGKGVGPVGGVGGVGVGGVTGGVLSDNINNLNQNNMDSQNLEDESTQQPRNRRLLRRQLVGDAAQSTSVKDGGKDSSVGSVDVGGGGGVGASEGASTDVANTLMQPQMVVIGMFLFCFFVFFLHVCGGVIFVDFLYFVFVWFCVRCHIYLMHPTKDRKIKNKK